MNKLLLYIAAAALLVSCNALSPDPGPSDEVRLCASIVSEVAVTKTAATACAYTAGVPTSDNPLEADVWFSTTSGSYPGTKTNDYDVHTTISYTSSAYVKPSDTVTYPASGNLYCIGLYPRGDWVVADNGTKAELGSGAGINGSTDYMFAPQIEGTSDSHFPPQTFNHIQTWLKIRIHAKSNDAGNSWGKIRKITVESPGRPSIDLATGAVTYSTDAEDLVEITAYENEEPGLSLTTESTEVSSVFIGALASSECLNFKIWADEYLKTVSVTLDKNGSTEGKLYVVTLSFAALGIIEGTATVSAWEDESQDLTGV